MTTNVPKLFGRVSERQGRCLRFVVHTSDQPVLPGQLVNHIEWSFLPHSLLEAKAALEGLKRMKLVRKQGKGYTFTDLGISVCKYADTNNHWQSTASPPPRAPEYTGSVTTKKRPRRRKTRRKTS